MMLLALVLLAPDAGEARIEALASDVFELPAWDTTEATARRRWPILKPTQGGSHGESPHWREQLVTTDLLGVTFAKVAVFFDGPQRVMTKAAFFFADNLGEEEIRRRESLSITLQNKLGPPVEAGACYQIWQAKDAQVILERGIVTIVATGATRPSIDITCVRLAPLPPLKRKPGPLR